MGRRYKNPPIIEAVCEFRFGQDSPWDIAVPGLVYAEVRGAFPKRRQVRKLGVGILADEGAVKPNIQAADVMQFHQADEKALIQVGLHLLAINHLRPYPSWDKFLPMIEKALRTYYEVAAPNSIHRIGLRYVNRVEIPEQCVDLDDYFEFYPRCAPGFPEDHGPFLVGLQFPYENGRDVLRVQLASAHVERPGLSPITLDLDYFLAQPGKWSVQEAVKWVGDAHQRVEAAFEACITDRLRAMFEEV